MYLFIYVMIPIHFNRSVVEVHEVIYISHLSISASYFHLAGNLFYNCLSKNILISIFLSADVQGIPFPRVTVFSQFTQQTEYIDPLLNTNVGQTSNQYWVNVTSLLGIQTKCTVQSLYSVSLNTPTGITLDKISY